MIENAAGNDSDGRVEGPARVNRRGLNVKVPTKLMPATLIGRLLDRRDEHLAQRRRAELGSLSKLVSWQRLPDRRWRARVSSPDWPETIERAGRSRCEAIERADEALRLAVVYLSGQWP